MTNKDNGLLSAEELESIENRFVEESTLREYILLRNHIGAQAKLIAEARIVIRDMGQLEAIRMCFRMAAFGEGPPIMEQIMNIEQRKHDFLARTKEYGEK